MEMLKQDSPGLTDANRGSCREAWSDHREGPQHLSIRREISLEKNQEPRQHRNRKSWKIGPRPTGSIVGIKCQAVQEHKTRLGEAWQDQNRHRRSAAKPQSDRLLGAIAGQASNCRLLYTLIT